MTDATADPTMLRRLDRLIWLMVLVVTAVVLAAPLVSNFYLEVAVVRPTGRRLSGAGRRRLVLPELAHRCAACLGAREHRTAHCLRRGRRPPVLSRCRRRRRHPAARPGVRRLRSRNRLRLDDAVALAERGARDLHDVAPDLRQPAATDGARGAVPCLHRPARLASHVHARLCVRYALHHRAFGRAAGRRRVAVLRPDRSRRPCGAGGEHGLAGVHWPARRLDAGAGGARRRGRHHVPEPTCRTGGNPDLRAVADPAAALADPRAEHRDAGRDPDRRRALSDRRDRGCRYCSS